jgi:hypothetical protein
VYSLTEKVRFIEKVFGEVDLARNEKNVGVRCPVCPRSRSDKKKLVIKLEGDLCKCWVCGYRSKTILFLIKKYAPEHLQEYLETFYTGTRVGIELDVKPIVKLPNDFRLLAISRTNEPDVRAAHSYLSRRGITDDDLWFHKLGISAESRWRRRIIFPSFDCAGLLNNFVGRAIDQDVLPKYDEPGVPESDFVFNEIMIDWKKPVIICEGPFDSIKCGENSIPLLGSDLSEDSLLFERIVLNKTPVFLALDADMRETKVPKTAKKLREYDIDVRIVEVEHDPAILTKEEFIHAKHVSKASTFESSLLERLNIVSRVFLS